MMYNIIWSSLNSFWLRSVGGRVFSRHLDLEADCSRILCCFRPSLTLAAAAVTFPLKVLLKTTSTSCTPTVSCSVRAGSRSSLNGRHTSKHWCRSCGVKHRGPFVQFFYYTTFCPPGNPSLSADQGWKTAALGSAVGLQPGRPPCQGSCSKPSWASVIIRQGSLKFAAFRRIVKTAANTTASSPQILFHSSGPGVSGPSLSFIAKPSSTLTGPNWSVRLMKKYRHFIYIELCQKVYFC